MRARMPKTNVVPVEISSALPGKERHFFILFFCYFPDFLFQGPMIQTCTPNSEDPTIFFFQEDTALSSNQLNLMN